MNTRSGQALIVLISFAAIAVTVITSTVLISVASNTASGRTQEGSVALDIAESGAENALLRLLRDPSYTGETLSVGDGSVVISVSGSTTKTIVSEGTVGDHTRTIQVIASDSAGILTVSSWEEQ